MHFVSLVWFAWLTGTVATYWIVPHTWRDIWLMLVSLAFLAVHAPESALLLVFFSLLTYAFGKKRASRRLLACPGCGDGSQCADLLQGHRAGQS